MQQELFTESLTEVQKMRTDCVHLVDLHKAQFTKMTNLSETFKEEYEFFVFYEEDPDEPEIINGAKMRFFITERFKGGLPNEYISDIFLDIGNESPKGKKVFVYSKETGEWLS